MSRAGVPVVGAQHYRAHAAGRSAAELPPSPVAHVEALRRRNPELTRDRGEQDGVWLPAAGFAGQNPGIDQPGDREPRPGFGQLDGAVAEYSHLQPAGAHIGKHRKRVWTKNDQLALRASPGRARRGQRIVVGLDAVPTSEFAERGRQVSERPGCAFGPRFVERTPPFGHGQAERRRAAGGVLLPDGSGVLGVRVA